MGKQTEGGLQLVSYLSNFIEGVDTKNLNATLLFVDIVPRHLISYTDGRWSKYLSPNKMFQLQWCFIETIKRRFANLMETKISLTLFWSFTKRYISTIFLYNLPWLDFRTSIDLLKENSFTLKQIRTRWYSAKTIIDVDDSDDIVLLDNTTAKAESLLRSLV